MIKKFLKDQRGTFAMKFALVTTVLLMSTGVAIETTRLVQAESKLQAAADSAALTAALAFDHSHAEGIGLASKKGKVVFEENLSGITTIRQQIKFKKTDRNTILTNANLVLEPMLFTLPGINSLKVSAVSEVAIGSNIGAEIVLAIDATNSMAFDSNWDNVMDTVKDTLSQLEQYTGEDNIYVSLVPFQDRVNIGTARSDWLSTAPPSGWNGCVEPREGFHSGLPLMLNNDRPSVNPFEPNLTETSGWGNTKCPDVEIAGPENDVQALLDETSNYSTLGTGRFDVGLAWGWRMLTPEWSGLWDASNYPAPYLTSRKKYLILLTDGRSSAYEKEFTQQQDWDYNEASIDAFEHVVELCSDIKDDNIEIFVLRFDGNDHAESYFRSCASSDDHFVNVNDVSDVAYPFDVILSQFSGEIRLVR